MRCCPFVVASSGGWTVRQAVHHIADGHLNSYTRFRPALTEQTPTIKPFEEAAWAELPDAKSGPVEPSLALTDALHRRWVMLLRSLSDDDFKRSYRHPQRRELTPLRLALPPSRSADSECAEARTLVRPAQVSKMTPELTHR